MLSLRDSIRVPPGGSARVPAARAQSPAAPAHRRRARPRGLLALAALAVGPLPAGAAEALHIVVDEASLLVFDREARLLEYRYAPSPFKPYLRQWFTPAGVQVLRDAPADHLHHHALMYAVGVEGADFWSETAEKGRQVHRSLDGLRTARRERLAAAAFSQSLDWMAPGDRTPRLRERRTVEVYRPEPRDVALLSWVERLEPGPGHQVVRLGGSHYFGLGMRFVESMDRDGEFMTPEGGEGELVRGSERLRRGRWCAYRAAAAGQAVTVAFFDHPRNPRQATWFTMTAPFAYLSATLNLHREPLEVRAGAPLEVAYGVALWDGRLEPERIEEFYRKWLEWSGPLAGPPAPEQEAPR